MASKRFAIIADIHLATVPNDGTRVAPQDGSYVRVRSNAIARATVFAKTAEKYGADYLVLLGDQLQTGNTATHEALYTALHDAIEANSSGKIIPIYGNHDVGSATVQQFQTRFLADTTSGHRVVWADRWPGSGLQKRYVSGTYDDGTFLLVFLWGFGPGTGIIWDTDDLATYEYETGQKITQPGGAAENQLDWLKDTALAGIGKPAVIFCHEQMGTAEGASIIDASIRSGTPTAGQNIQTTLGNVVTGGQAVHVFSGHYHRVTSAYEPAYHLKETISGADYYTLRGSVLGRNKSDLRGNTFFIIDIDDSVGVTNIRTIKYSTSIRDRYDPYDIDNILPQGIRGRERVS